MTRLCLALAIITLTTLHPVQVPILQYTTKLCEAVAQAGLRVPFDDFFIQLGENGVSYWMEQAQTAVNRGRGGDYVTRLNASAVDKVNVIAKHS